jgi:hypothetical protein
MRRTPDAPRKAAFAARTSARWIVVKREHPVQFSWSYFAND